MDRFSLKLGVQPRLPAFVAGTELTLAMPRREPLAGMWPQVSAELTNLGLDGEKCAELRLPSSSFHVVAQVGFQFVVTADNMSMKPQFVNPLAAYVWGEAVEAAPGRPIAPALAAFWRLRGYNGLLVHEVWRQIPALVIGQIAADADPADWLGTDNGRWRIQPGAYLVRELNGRDARIIPPTFAVREFEHIVTPYGEVVERFELAET